MKDTSPLHDALSEISLAQIDDRGLVYRARYKIVNVDGVGIAVHTIVERGLRKFGDVTEESIPLLLLDSDIANKSSREVASMILGLSGLCAIPEKRIPLDRIVLALSPALRMHQSGNHHVVRSVVNGLIGVLGDVGVDVDKVLPMCGGFGSDGDLESCAKSFVDDIARVLCEVSDAINTDDDYYLIVCVIQAIASGRELTCCVGRERL